PTVDAATGEAAPPMPLPDTVDRNDEVLTVENLTVRFDIAGGFGRKLGRVHAVENTSFSLRAGETLAIVGESGCGKATTGRAVMGLRGPSGGTIRIGGRGGRAMAGSDPRERCRLIQMVFQDPYASLNPRLTIGSAIAAPILAHRLSDRNGARERVADLLE